jgi:diguanylate cyclase (GGDEF)-like protein
LNRVADPAILLPLIAIVLLTTIWTLTLGLIKLTRADAVHGAAVSSREILGTYEAQVVRALHQIEQTLNLVRFWHESGGRPRALAELQDKGLLPPELVFTVSIANRAGDVVDSTRPLHAVNIAAADYFRGQSKANVFFVGQPSADLAGSADSAGDRNLEFSERLTAADGSFDGVVVVAVDPAYFVSGYESSQLGEQGVLGLVGTDGVVRIKRTGDVTSSGARIDYAALTMRADPDAEDADIPVAASSWDGVRRWTSARELYGFPLAVFAGLSESEQLAPARRTSRIYVWRAIAGSALAIVLTAVLGRMSWDLRRSREREHAADLEHARRTEYLAYHDGLTGLPNRGLFSKLLSQYIADATRETRTLAVAFLDLDRFKRINDTLGHEAGDELLREVANRLTGCVRASDVVARLGGDEFVVLLPESPAGMLSAAVAQRILAAIARPFTLVGQKFEITASVGICTYPKDGLDEQTLIKNADIAMYQAKSEGKNNFQYYSEELNANSLERLTLESSLRQAVAREEFSLWYQAEHDIGSGKITGMEALLRWKHPELGMVEPARFMPIAEETGLIVPIGRWVLETACAQNVAWRRAGAPRMTVAVSLTARQFAHERLFEDVAAALKSTGMEPNLLELAIAESLLFEDDEATLRVVRGLKAQGVRIAISDFGAGATSLATLQLIPLDTIKIDRALIRADADGNGLAAAVIAMGKSLSRNVVAKCVETREQAEFLRGHAGDEIQGYYFNRPLPPEEFVKLLLAPPLEITYIGKPLGV